MKLEDILKLLGQVNAMLPLVLAVEKAIVALFKDATPGLSNTERIALLRSAGMKLEEKGVAWFAEVGLEL